MNNLATIKDTLEVIKNKMIIAHFEGELESPEKMGRFVRYVAEILKDTIEKINRLKTIDRVPLLPLDDNITTIDRMVYVVLYELDRTNEALPNSDICEMVGCSETSFVNSAKRLEEFGYIKKERNVGLGYGRNVYRITEIPE